MQGRRAISMLNGVLWDEGISKANKKNIYNTVVKSIITYGSEVWQLKSRTENMLLATEMDYWRRSAGKSKRAQITNDRNGRRKATKEYNEMDPNWKKKTRKTPRDMVKGVTKAMSLRNLQADDWMDRRQWRQGTGRRITM
ncbi:uncharacterized protein LOC115890751 [Sitophilus oryzae]|uniref:Uncharacterized protein LOC115890751 n=1 Tax=Sitophilus oryzae TaxID=7048 RepID=A0A6J2YS68_SITOR|nr:uncharacterized protein LOC115890751 [Sitophilus oryzae]